MRNLTCIVCPIGCALDIDDSNDRADKNEDNLSVTGNRCARGITYALEEIRAPRRVVTATVPLHVGKTNEIAGSVRRIPVKTSSPCLREKIPALLQDIYKMKVSIPVKVGDIIISDWNGEGIDVVATRTING